MKGNFAFEVQFFYQIYKTALIIAKNLDKSSLHI